MRTSLSKEKTISGSTSLIRTSTELFHHIPFSPFLKAVVSARKPYGTSFKPMLSTMKTLATVSLWISSLDSSSWSVEVERKNHSGSFARYWQSTNRCQSWEVLTDFFRMAFQRCWSMWRYCTCWWMSTCLFCMNTLPTCQTYSGSINGSKLVSCIVFL